MIHKLFRKYNQNRKTIWVVIIFIAFFVILLQAVFALIRSNKAKEQQELLNAYYQSQNQSGNSTVNSGSSENIIENTTQIPETITTSSSSEEVINYFVNLCNQNKIEEAYNMISEDCKSVLFPTINDFKNNYYDKVFNGQKDVKIEKSMYEGEIYKVTYMSNLLANGGYQSENTLEDYIYIVEDSEEVKLSFNKFLYIEDINKTSTNRDVSIRVLKKKIFIDYEEYQIQVVNNSGDSIYITPDEEKVYLLDENDIEYTSSIDELQNGLTLVEPGKSITFELTFYKNWRFRKKSKIY